jgi:hypothetical protein
MAASLRTIANAMHGSENAFGATITIRRGDTTLSAQDVRVGLMRSYDESVQETAREQQSRITVIGSTTFNVQVGDRFTVNDTLFRVNFVNPNRQVVTVAECEAVQ